MPDVFVAPEDEVRDAPTIPTKKADRKNASLMKEGAASQVRIFSSFCPLPQGVRFENQEKNESIQLFLRRHIVTNIGWVLFTLFLTLLPLLVPFILAVMEPSFVTIPFRFALIVISFYYLIVFGYGFVNFVTWFYNVGIISSLRVLDIDISHITYKNIASVDINDIVDVTYVQHSLFNNLFDYGDLHLQTEGLKPNFEFHAVPHPAQIADIISDLTRGGRHG